MGRRGPKRVPTALLEARGSSLAPARKRTEPRPPPGIAQPPAGLDGAQRATFRRLAAELQRMGVLASIDAQALGRYVQLLHDWRAARRALKKDGRYVTQVSREGNSRLAVHPAVIDAGALAGQLLRLEQQFGLTPSARASLAVNPEDREDAGGEDEAADYFTA